MITTSPIDGSPVYDGRMTGGRKGIPYDLSPFDSVVAGRPVAASPVDAALEKSDRVLVAA